MTSPSVLDSPLSFDLAVSPPAPGVENMALDAALFEGLREGKKGPGVRVYTWRERTITLGRGYKTKFKMNDEALGRLYAGIPILERPTGGGLVVHEPIGEVTIALVHYRPAGEAIRELYKRIHEPILDAIAKAGGAAGKLVSECLPEGDGVCFNSPCLYDGVINGKKVLGGGLRIGRAWTPASAGVKEYIFLYQGTLKMPGMRAEDLVRAISASDAFVGAWGKPIIQRG